MSETNELEALLRRWAELEPGRCRLDTATNDLGVMLRDNWKKGLTFMGEPDPERIQGAVQEAIEARGWHWTIQGKIQKTYAHIDNIGGGAYADSPAAALLKAYLAAVKSISP